jgi:hypothetical protein
MKRLTLFLIAVSFYTIKGEDSYFPTTVEYVNDTALTIDFTYNGSQTYDVRITDGGTTYSGSDYDLTSANAPAAFSVYNNGQKSGAGDNWNISFNNMQITDNGGGAVPEPASMALFTVAGLLLFGMRRKLRG